MSAEKEAPEFIDLLLWVAGATAKRWKPIAIATTVAALASVIFVLFIADEKFESYAVITPPAPTDAMSAMKGLSDELGPISGLLGMSLGGESEIELILALLAKAEMHEAIIKRFSLDSVYEFRKNPPKKYFKADLLTKFRKDFGAEEGDENSFITVVMRDEDAQRSVEIVNVAIEMLDSAYRQLKSKQAQRMRVFYETRLSLNKQALDSLKEAMVVFQNKTKILDPEIQLEASYKGLANLESQKEIVQIELEAERLIHGDGTSMGRKLEQQVLAMEKSLARLRTTGSQSGALVSMKNISGLSRDYFNIYEEIKILDAIQIYLRKLYEQAVLKEVNDVQSFDVIERPWVNDKRVSPPRRIVVSSITLATLLLGVLYAVLMELYFAEKAVSGRRYQKLHEIIDALKGKQT